MTFLNSSRRTYAALALALVSSLIAARGRAQDAGVEPGETVTLDAGTDAPDAGAAPDLSSLSRGIDAGAQSEPEAIDVLVMRDRDDGPLGRADVLTSSSVLSGEMAQLGTVSDPLQLLKRLPGAYSQDYNQGVTSTGLAIRGFNTEDNNGFVKLLVDGIPTNFHGGSMDLKAVFPLEMDRIELITGTNDARYGLNNVAGNINVFTRQGEDVRQVRLLGGSYATIEPQLLYGQRTGPFHQTYFLGYRSAEGFRQNSRMDRVAGSAKWFYEPSARLKVGLIARAMKLDAESPGFLDRDVARTHPRRVPDFAVTDWGEQRTLHLSAHLDYIPVPGLSLQLKTYVQSLDRTRIVQFDALVPQQKRVEDELQHGAIATLTYRARGARAHDFVLEWGADYQGQINENRRFNTIARVPQGGPTRDLDFKFAAAGSYLQTSIKPIPSLRIVGAVRADYLWGTLTDELKQREFAMSDFGVIWQPKLSAAWTFYEGQRLYANYGRTYQVGTQTGAYKTATGSSVDPSINDGWEAGVRSTLGRWASTRVAIWEQLASQEVRLKMDASGDSENIGKTKRYGLDVEASVAPVSWLSLWGVFSPVRAEQSEPGAANRAQRGKDLNHVPWYSTKGGLDFRKIDGLLISLWCYAQSDYYLTKTNAGGKFGGYYVVNLDATYQATDWLSVALSIQNLTNAQYDTAVWWRDYGTAGSPPSSQHSPASPVSAFASATLSL